MPSDGTAVDREEGEEEEEMETEAQHAAQPCASGGISATSNEDPRGATYGSEWLQHYYGALKSRLASFGTGYQTTRDYITSSPTYLYSSILGPGECEKERERERAREIESSSSVSTKYVCT